jgi:surface protein
MRKILSGRRGSSQPFEFQVDVTSAAPQGTGANTFKLPLPSGTPAGGNPLNFLVDWGDGSSLQVNAANHGSAQHTYSSGGVKTIKIYGAVRGWSFGSSSSGNNDAVKMYKILNWGGWRSTENRQFDGCNQLLEITASDYPVIEVGSSWFRMFAECSALKTISNINSWKTGACTNMYAMFYNCVGLNSGGSGGGAGGTGDLFLWDVSKVATMKFMFMNCSSMNWRMFTMSSTTTDGGAYNQSMNSWNVSNVTRMDGILRGQQSFNQNLSSWNLTGINSVLASNPPLAQTNFNLSTANYDALLVAWDALNYPSMPAGSTLSFGTSQYSLGSAAATARSSLITKWGGISDGGGV